MKGMQQWNTARKWSTLCHNASQLILHILKFGGVSVCNTGQKWNCNNRDGLAQEHLQVILRYPDDGNGGYVAHPGYGKSMSIIPQGGSTESKLCHCQWGTPSCPTGSMQVLWFISNTYWSSEGLQGHFNNTNNIYNQLIAHWRLLPFTLYVCPRLPPFEKTLPQ